MDVGEMSMNLRRESRTAQRSAQSRATMNNQPSEKRTAEPQLAVSHHVLTFIVLSLYSK